MSAERRGVPPGAAPHRMGWLMIWFDILYDNDCGLTRHAGDNEAFGVSVDTSLQGTEAIRAVRAISHQGTACQNITTCGSCPGLDTCTTSMRGGHAVPVVFHSKNKHG